MSLDFKLENYTEEEIEDIFGLSGAYPPSSKLILEERSQEIIEKVKDDSTINEQLKEETVQFLIKAKHKLEEKLFGNLEPAPPVGPVIVSASSALNKANSFFSSFVSSPYDTPFEDRVTPVNDEKGAYSHAVQMLEPNPKSYSHSYPSEYYQGIINPLQKRVIRLNINIDTRFRNNYFQTLSTDYLFTLPMELNPVLSMQLTSIEIPNSYFVISRSLNNNAFSIGCGDEKIVYVVPDGNYTPEDLVTFLNLYAVNNGYTALSNPALFHMVFALNIHGSPPVGESGSAQLVIGVSSTYGPIPFSFRVVFNESDSGVEDTNTPLQWKLGWMLGFRSAIYDGGSSYVSEGIVDLNGPRYAYLSIDDFQNSVNNGFYAALNSSVINNNILARITFPNDKTKFFQVFNWSLSSNANFVTTTRQYFGPADLFKIHIRLLDEYGRVMNLNNMDFSFCLSLEAVYNL